MVGRDANRIGEQDPARWQRIAAVYRQFGLLTDDTLPAALIWGGNDDSLRRWLISLVLVLVGMALRRRSRIEVVAHCGSLSRGWARLVRLSGWGDQG